MYEKAQRLSRDTTPGTLEQLKEDMNTGYKMFNAKLSRYFSRKQQFTNIIDGQGIYQTPVDCVRVIGMTASVGDSTNAYKLPLKEIRSEYEWRNITSYPYSSNWPVYYFMLGNDELQLWPTPSQNVTNGLRFYYQQQDYDLSVDDTTSSSVTVSVTNGSPTVTASASIFNPQMANLWFQLQGVTNLQWYEIVDVPTDTTLTLKSAFVGNSGSGLGWKVGQLSILPEEYQDAPINYALYLFFSGKGNEARANQHLALFEKAVTDAVAAYSSSTEGNVISDDSNYVNSWYITPLPPSGG
jgi:hypothetical protein